MECPRCGEKLKVSHTYKTPVARTQRSECPGCLTVTASVIFIVSVNPDEGEGARALASRLNRGEAIEVVLPKPESPALAPQAIEGSQTP